MKVCTRAVLLLLAALLSSAAGAWISDAKLREATLAQTPVVPNKVTVDLGAITAFFLRALLQRPNANGLTVAAPRPL